MKAMAENQDIEGILKFYRPNPTGDGTIEQYYTIRFTKSRVVSIRHYRPEAIAAGTDNLFNLEEIGFIIGTINWTYTNGGVMYQDTTIQKPK